MKKFIIIFLFLSVKPLVAQVKSVWTDVYGNVKVMVEVGNRSFVVVDTYGEIIDMMIPDNYVEFYSNFYSYEAGKIKNMGGIGFTYYSDFYDDESGKVKTIGGIEFRYYSNFYDYESGKIKSIGNVNFAYYSNFYDYEAGKIKNIGGVEFKYYSNFNDYEKGKVKSIGNNQYEYFSQFDGVPGQFKSGRSRFVANNIEFNIMIKRPRSNHDCPWQ